MLRDDGAAGLCATCHGDPYTDRQHVHGPVAVGGCVVCHESHSSDQEKLLTATPGTLCVRCHQESVPRGAERRHLHSPMNDGCLTCHDPHASDVKSQLHQAVPDLCLPCHEGVKTLMDSAPVVHGALTAEGGCVACHNPHFSPFVRLQRGEQREVCISCHDREMTAADGRTLSDMATLLEENPDHHGPVREGLCTACHDPHAGERPSLLFQAYPPEFYAPFSTERYALCFSCHLSELVRDESGTGLTRFRDGDRNLHWLHVNQRKGRTCRACHEVHASKRPFHIREAVPFGIGGWMLEINFTQTADGGRCAPACHKPKTYSRSASAAPGAGDVPNETGADP